MIHWIISDLPYIAVGICACVYAITYFEFDLESGLKSLIGIYASMISTCVLITIFLIHYSKKVNLYDEKLEKIVIPEFIENRPFKETNVMQKDEILTIILRNVNSKFISEMRRNYTFRNIDQLVKFHDKIIAKFTKKYFETYKDLPLEDIQGWDKMLLVAKNIQDEDMKDVYADMVSPEIIQKYSSIRPTTQENGLAASGD
mmetsp:Transcript_884/g.866  ORF Transcript_884/g.866 Transcript_884/m.866 type:complete len:201 (-) Transcript_884:103-705(-)